MLYVNGQINAEGQSVCQSPTIEKPEKNYNRNGLCSEFLQYKAMFITFRYGSILEDDKGLWKATFGQNKAFMIIELTCEDC